MPAAKMCPLGVFLASADLAQNSALCLVFEQQQGVRIVGGAKDTHDALHGVLDSGADFLLLDWELPVRSELSTRNGEGTPELAVPDLITRLRSSGEHLHIVVLTLKPEFELVAMRAGADAVMVKTSAPERMLAALITQIREAEMLEWNGQNNSSATHPCA